MPLCRCCSLSCWNSQFCCLFTSGWVIKSGRQMPAACQGLAVNGRKGKSGQATRGLNRWAKHPFLTVEQAWLTGSQLLRGSRSRSAPFQVGNGTGRLCLRGTLYQLLNKAITEFHCYSVCSWCFSWHSLRPLVWEANSFPWKGQHLERWPCRSGPWRAAFCRNARGNLQLWQSGGETGQELPPNKGEYKQLPSLMKRAPQRRVSQVGHKVKLSALCQGRCDTRRLRAMRSVCTSLLCTPASCGRSRQSLTQPVLHLLLWRAGFCSEVSGLPSQLAQKASKDWRGPAAAHGLVEVLLSCPQGSVLQPCALALGRPSGRSLQGVRQRGFVNSKLNGEKWELC